MNFLSLCRVACVAFLPMGLSSCQNFMAEECFSYPRMEAQAQKLLIGRLVKEVRKIRVHESVSPFGAQNALVYDLPRTPQWDALFQKWLAVPVWYKIVKNKNCVLSIAPPTHLVHLSFLDASGKVILLLNDSYFVDTPYWYGWCEQHEQPIKSMIKDCLPLLKLKAM